MRTIEEAISEVKRELGVRRRCYRRWVDDGKLTAVEAVDRLERLEAAQSFLERTLSLSTIPVPAPPLHTTAAPATGEPPLTDVLMQLLVVSPFLVTCSALHGL